MKKPNLVSIVAMLFLALSVIAGKGAIRAKELSISEARLHQSQSIADKLSYLRSQVPDVAFIEAANEGHGSNIVVGFRSMPRDLEGIVGSAARRASKASNFSVHVWAVPSEQGSAYPPQQFYCSATARDGRLQISDC